MHFIESILMRFVNLTTRVNDLNCYLYLPINKQSIILIITCKFQATRSVILLFTKQLMNIYKKRSITEIQKITTKRLQPKGQPEQPNKGSGRPAQEQNYQHK